MPRQQQPGACPSGGYTTTSTASSSPHLDVRQLLLLDGQRGRRLVVVVASQGQLAAGAVFNQLRLQEGVREEARKAG